MTFEGSAEQNWPETLTGEMLVSGLVGRALYAPPDRVWLDSLVADGVFGEAPFGPRQRETAASLGSLQTWSAANRQGLSDAAWDALQSDHTRLFVGPGKLLAPPWQSVYADRDRLVFQLLTVKVNALYERFGLELASTYREPADHVGLQFEFLSHLGQLSLQALDEGNTAEFSELCKAQREFLRDHLVRWVPRWARDVDAHAQTEFYRGMARLACGVLRDLDAVFAVTAPRPSARLL
jgi:TorA maturation chaperone TorD